MPITTGDKESIELSLRLQCRRRKKHKTNEATENNQHIPCIFYQKVIEESAPSKGRYGLTRKGRQESARKEFKTGET
jgi:hypothetical protein